MTNAKKRELLSHIIAVHEKIIAERREELKALDGRTGWWVLELPNSDYVVNSSAITKPMPIEYLGETVTLDGMFTPSGQHAAKLKPYVIAWGTYTL